MINETTLDDGLCRTPRITMCARQLLSTVCILGGADCPLLEQERAREILAQVREDPTLTIRLESNADEVAHYSKVDPEDAFNRKRDLDVLQRLGMLPGSTWRARHMYTVLFERIETPSGICAYDTLGWEGCPLAQSGAYESVRAKGWEAVVYQRSGEEMREYRERNVKQIAEGERLCIRPHHLMCLCCWYAGGEGQSPRPNDTIYEILQRIQREPDVPITLVEGCCHACECCDGFHPETRRCVHAGGLIRDFKKDLDVFQKLGLMPGATMGASELFDLLFERIPSAGDVCGYSDGVVRSEEWGICGGVTQEGYELTRRTGIF